MSYLPKSNLHFLLTLWLHRNQKSTVKLNYTADKSCTHGRNEAFAKTC